MQKNKELIYGLDALLEIQKGVKLVVNAVKMTLGPAGANGSLETYSDPIVTNDGVSIARSIKVENHFQQMGVRFAQNAAAKTEAEALDGTTTTIVLLDAILDEAIKIFKISDNPINVMSIKAGIENAASIVISQLKSQAIPVKTLEEIINVANISVENMEVAETIAKLLYEIGTDGLVTVAEKSKPGVSVDRLNGMKINKGYAHDYIINNYERMSGEYDDVPVLVTSKKVLISKEILPLLESVAKNGNKKLLLIADDIDGEALASFALNRAQGYFDIIPVRFPVFGEGKYDELEDIAIRCGTFVVGDKSAIKIKDMTPANLGYVKQCKVTRDNTLLIGVKDEYTQGEVDKRIETLRTLSDNTDDTEEKNTYTARISNLLSKIAVVRVGGSTDTDRRYLKLKVDDAVGATLGAMQEGVVAGGGWALMYNASQLPVATAAGDRGLGHSILYNAIRAPYCQILINCGIQKVDVVQGFNAKTLQFTDDLIAEGVVDPVKVTICALKNASATGAMIATIRFASADKDDKNYENA